MRYVLGPKFDMGGTAPNLPPTGKPDVVVTAKAVGQTVTVSVPAYDPTAVNPLIEVRAYLVPAGQPVPADGPAYVASPYPFGLSTLSGSGQAGDVTVTLPSPVPAAPQLGQIVLGMAN